VTGTRGVPHGTATEQGPNGRGGTASMEAIRSSTNGADRSPVESPAIVESHRYVESRSDVLGDPAGNRKTGGGE
jgi:hypothetical protein